MNETVIIRCPSCKSKLRVPCGKGTLAINCPACKYAFSFDTPELVATEPVKEQQVVRPAPPTYERPTYQPQCQPTATRTLTIRRLTHAYKNLSYHGIKNAFLDVYPIHIFLDGQRQGMLNKAPVVLEMDSWEHYLSPAVFASKYRIPAGNENYVAYFFNDKFKIGPEEDPFRDDVIDFVLNMVRGQGFRDRIKNWNNHNHEVAVTAEPDHIRISWSPEKTKGLLEWATGEKTEKIFYSQIGLVPPNGERLPDGYWEYLDLCIREAVEDDPQADLEYGSGGFTFRRTHNLY